MRKPILRYVELYSGHCTIETGSNSEIIRRLGCFNVKFVRAATKKDVEWVKAFGGHVPDGKCLKQRAE
jgi:hypothetical protein